MNTKKILLKASSIPLTLYLLSLLSFHFLIKLSGYIFIPFNELTVNVFTAGIIIWLTIRGIKNKNEKTKATVVFSALLPLIALIYIVIKFISISSDISCEIMIIYVLHASITLACSMIIFFSCGRGKAVRIVFGIIYSVVLSFVCFMLYVMLVFSIYGFIAVKTVEKSVMSPNAVYLAEIISIDSGATGGETVVNVTRQNRDINLIIGELKKAPKEIYYGRWSEFYEMTIEWATDDMLYINGNGYIIT